jgi:hypothetical protein
MDRENLIFFMHIPKTAGTTLHQIIRQQYSDREIFPAYVGVGAATLQEHINNLKYRLDQPVNQLLDCGQEIKIILGHVGFGLHEIIGRELTYITFLRHPVDRVISWYYHQQRVKNAKYHQECQSMSLTEIITHFPIPTDNHQTRYLSGDFLQQQLGKPNTIAYGGCSLELLEKAKENLKNYFSVVGIQEDFEASLALCQKVLHWQPVNYVAENVGKDKRQISQSELDFIADCNSWDLQLYEYGQKLFSQQLIDFEL